MSVLQQARFFTTADNLSQLPVDGLPELAFAGRSNAGKSTAINTLCHQKRLAFASRTPGRTQHLNFFAVGRDSADPERARGYLVDLPGYGYAAVSRSSKEHWGEVLARYVRERQPLVGLVLVMDSRHPMTRLDRDLLDWFVPTGRPVHILLTKSDKLNRSEQARALRETEAVLREYGPLHTVQLFSALKRQNVDAAQARVEDLLGLSEVPWHHPPVIDSGTG